MADAAAVRHPQDGALFGMTFNVLFAMPGNVAGEELLEVAQPPG